MPSMRLDLAGC